MQEGWDKGLLLSAAQEGRGRRRAGQRRSKKGECGLPEIVKLIVHTIEI